MFGFVTRKMTPQFVRDGVAYISCNEARVRVFELLIVMWLDEKAKTPVNCPLNPVGRDMIRYRVYTV